MTWRVYIPHPAKNIPFPFVQFSTYQHGVRMKAALIVGVLLIILGVVGFALGGFSFTHKKKDVSMGPVQISHNQTKTVPIPPALSIISLLAGVGLVVVGARAK